MQLISNFHSGRWGLQTRLNLRAYRLQCKITVVQLYASQFTPKASSQQSAHRCICDTVYAYRTGTEFRRRPIESVIIRQRRIEYLADGLAVARHGPIDELSNLQLSISARHHQPDRVETNGHFHVNSRCPSICSTLGQDLRVVRTAFLTTDSTSRPVLY